MAVPISTIVNVQIVLQDKAVTQAGFGVPLILGQNSSGWSERVRSYVNLDEVGDDFLTTDAEYIAAGKIFGQLPKVPLLKIGREAARQAMVQTITFSGNLVTGNVINGNIAGIPITPVPFNTSNAQTLTNLAGEIQSKILVDTAVSNGISTITITSQNPGLPATASAFVVTGGASQATVIIATTTANHGPAEDLSEILEEDSDWYGLIWTERNAGLVVSAASFIETQRKIFITCSDDASILSAVSTTDIAYLLNASNYTRTAVIYNATPEDFADAAWMGAVFPIDPGKDNWKFKTLIGITADDLTSTQRAAAVAKEANLYYEVGGVDITAEGTMAQGAPYFIDVIRSIDWLQAQIEERIFSKLVSNTKIAYTDAGIAIIESELRGALEFAEARGVIADDPKYTASVPKATAVPQIDRTNRILNDVQFDCRLSGALNHINVQGVVTV